MSGVDFVDSNVFIYMFDLVDQDKRDKANRLVQTTLESGNGVISYQVVQETLNVLTHKMKKPCISSEDASRLLESVLAPMWKVMPSADLFKRALRNKNHYALSFYDSLIVAAAQEANCTRLYSEDMQHGQLIGKLRIVNPFVVA